MELKPVQHLTAFSRSQKVVTGQKQTHYRDQSVTTVAHYPDNYQKLFAAPCYISCVNRQMQNTIIASMMMIIWVHGVSLQALAVSSSSRQQMHLLVIVPPHIREHYTAPLIGERYTVIL